MADEISVKIVCDQAGVDDVQVARDTLEKCDGDVALAISMLLFPDRVEVTTPKPFEDLSDVEKLRCVVAEKEKMMYHLMATDQGQQNMSG
jgi:hypothetical protein